MFEGFIARINQQVTSYLSKGMVPIQKEEPIKEARPQRTDFGRTNKAMEQQQAERQAMREAAANSGREPQRQVTAVRTDPKVGRNDLCPCGSGKKFKNCHGVGA